MVALRIIPNMPGVLIREDAAKHLLRLLARYNWCLEDVSTFEVRWKRFWPTLRWCERATVRLFLCAHGGVRVGQRVSLEGSSESLHEGAHRPMTIPPEVESAFMNVLGQHYQRLTSPAEILSLWRARWPAATASIGVAAAKEAWFEQPEGFVPWSVFERARRHLMLQGWSAETAQHASAALAVALHKHLQMKEDEVCEA